MAHGEVNCQCLCHTLSTPRGQWPMKKYDVYTILVSTPVLGSPKGTLMSVCASCTATVSIPSVCPLQRSAVPQTACQCLYSHSVHPICLSTTEVSCPTDSMNSVSVYSHTVSIPSVCPLQRSAVPQTACQCLCTATQCPSHLSVHYRGQLSHRQHVSVCVQPHSVHPICLSTTEVSCPTDSMSVSVYSHTVSIPSVCPLQRSAVPQTACQCLCTATQCPSHLSVHYRGQLSHRQHVSVCVQPHSVHPICLSTTEVSCPTDSMMCLCTATPCPSHLSVHYRGQLSHRQHVSVCAQPHSVHPICLSTTEVSCPTDSMMSVCVHLVQPHRVHTSADGGQGFPGRQGKAAGHHTAGLAQLLGQLLLKLLHLKQTENWLTRPRHIDSFSSNCCI